MLRWATGFAFAEDFLLEKCLGGGATTGVGRGERGYGGGGERRAEKRTVEPNRIG